ncbi:MAG TPA: tRNA1(Val) (adenine(37)-N6)-methyltransferase [Smithellaceae bacterium]|nr:tRNA1(Val) (adenine(37)-N6)-methyltransferase [Smithellaceae bacterium]HRS90036.1 tRNA1(Val) (adenine(37)-N6)-methyltransferase [Smithellaceae bacterium]HRV26876.1 tRNA1(Val) (adenine(37)-N6)-methyltransferase [Smithellaceae bacterium]
MNAETLDDILNGQLKICQRRNGYRFSLDALLLAHFVSLRKNTHAVELGCGSGVIMLIMASRFPHVHFTGLEIQDELWELAQKNICINSLNERVAAIRGDAKDIKKYLPKSSFDCVFFNPPYRMLNSGRINPDSQKAIARHEIKGSVTDFIQAAKYLIKPNGKIFVIYPAKRLAHLIWTLKNNYMEPKRMRLVFSAADMPAEFVLVEAANQGREELKVEPPLYVFDQDKKYTPQMKIIFRELASPPGGVAG